MRKSLITVLGPTDPVHDLTTVEAVNNALNINGSPPADAVTAEQITTASRLIADLCNAGPDRLRTFGLLTLQEDFRVQWGEPVHTLYLRQYPVEQVTSITQDGSEADTSMYELDEEAGLLWMKCGRWSGPVVAEYSGGYDLPDAAPPLLARACIQLIKAARVAAESAGINPNVRSVQHGDTAVSYFGAVASGNTSSSETVPQDVLNLIDRYIRRSV